MNLPYFLVSSRNDLSFLEIKSQRSRLVRFYLLSIKKTKFNLPHLQEKLIDSHYIPKGNNFTQDDVKIFLIKRFNEINFNEAKSDVMPFIKDISVLDIWSKEFFTSVTSELRT